MRYCAHAPAWGDCPKKNSIRSRGTPANGRVKGRKHAAGLSKIKAARKCGINGFSHSKSFGPICAVKFADRERQMGLRPLTTQRAGQYDRASRRLIIISAKRTGSLGGRFF
jgi:hypothetical protein